jgi:hypothetical protein
MAASAAAPSGERPPVQTVDVNGRLDYTTLSWTLLAPVTNGVPVPTARIPAADVDRFKLGEEERCKAEFYLKVTPKKDAKTKIHLSLQSRAGGLQQSGENRRGAAGRRAEGGSCRRWGLPTAQGQEGGGRERPLRVQGALLGHVSSQ